MEKATTFLKKNWLWLVLLALIVVWYVMSKKMIMPGDMVTFIAESKENDAFKKGTKYKVLEVTKTASGNTLYMLQSGEIKGEFSSAAIKKA